MSLIPDKILTEEEISNFIKDANSNADQIVGESKFKISPPEVPGSGLLIKLWIRQIEQGLSTYIAPIAAFKNVISNANPAKLIGELTSLIGDVTSFFSDPLQSILDLTINKKISEESPFPIKLLHDESSGSQSGDLSKILQENSLRSLNKSAAAGLPASGYQYSVISDPTGQVPLDKGYMILNSSDASKTTIIRISPETSDGKNTEDYIASLEPGQVIFISLESKRYPLKINSISSGEGGGFNLNVSRPDDASLDNVGGVQMAYPPGLVSDGSPAAISSNFSMDPSSPQFNPALSSIKNFIIQDPELGFVIKIPLSAVLSGIPLVNKISIRIGNFSDLAPENPTRLYIDKAESRSGMKFNDLLASLLSGRYPVLDFFKIAENEKTPGKNPKEEAQLEIAGLAKLIEMAITDPLGFIQVIVSYIKLLLIPINFLFGVLEIILSKITSPSKVIGLVIKITTDPIGFFCDLVSDAVLEVLRSYVSPALQAANITYDEAKETQERGKTLGLKLLVSEIVCGKFFKKFRDYSPNSGVLNQISNTQNPASQQGTSAQNEPADISFAYRISFGDKSPERGELVFLNPEDSQSNTIRVNVIDASNESPLSYMRTVVPGQNIKIAIDGKDWEYSVISSFLNAGYFSFSVGLSSSPDAKLRETVSVDQQYLDSIESPNKSELLKRSIESLSSQISSIKDQISSGSPNKDLLTKKVSDLEAVKSGLEAEAGLSVVSIKNPDLMYLFLVENYLPTKVVAVWESIKGILGLFLGTLVTFPSLLPAVFKSIFSGPSQAGMPEQSNLEISTGITADLVQKMSDTDGLLAQLNENSEVDGDGEPRKSVREFIDISLFSDDPEDLIDNSMLGIKDDVEASGFSLSVDGEPLTYEDFIKRFKIIVASYNALRDKKEIVTDRTSRTTKLSNDITQTQSKIKATAAKVELYAKEVKTYVESLEKIQNGVYKVTDGLDKTTGFVNKIISYISDSLYSLINRTYSGLSTKLLPGVNSQLRKTEKTLEELNSDIASIESNIKGNSVYTYEIYNGVVAGDVIPFLPGAYKVVLAAKAGKEIARSTESLVEGFLANFDKITKSLGVAKDGSNAAVAVLIQVAISAVEKTRSAINRALTQSADVGISVIEKKLDNATNRLVAEQKSLNGYRERLEFLLYIRDTLQTQKFFSLWDSENAKYNYFGDKPINMTAGLRFNESEISGTLVDLYRDYTLKSDPFSRIPEGEPIRLNKFREILLKDLSVASEILRKIK